MVFLVSIDRKNPLNISAEGLQFIISMFSCLILKLKSPSSTSFCLYFAFAEYRTDYSSSPAERNVSPPARTVSPAASTEIVSGTQEKSILYLQIYVNFASKYMYILPTNTYICSKYMYILPTNTYTVFVLNICIFCLQICLFC